MIRSPRLASPAVADRPMFTKILIANRGEIACRVIRTARRLAHHDRRRVLGRRRARAARSRRRRGLPHRPGRGEGKLSSRRPHPRGRARRPARRRSIPATASSRENEDFAEACERAGIVFIGPPASAIRAMGSKSAAKRIMGAAGVPLVPGYHGDEQDPAFLQREADRIGYPVLIKASAGGGGKGMRIVEAAADFAAALASCTARGGVGLRRRPRPPREVPPPRRATSRSRCSATATATACISSSASARSSGATRRSSRRAPAPGMTAERRAAMGGAAVAAAKAIGYVGAGTVEFIAERDGGHVLLPGDEHAAPGRAPGHRDDHRRSTSSSGSCASPPASRCPKRQDELRIDGHAIEARVYAEDPAKGFLPATGRIVHLGTPPASRHVRIDTGVAPATRSRRTTIR